MRVMLRVFAYKARVLGYMLLLVAAVGVAQTPPDVDGARHNFAACVKNSTNTLLKAEGATPSTVAYFTALACNTQREAYRMALVATGIPDVDSLMTRVDLSATLSIRRSWETLHHLTPSPR